MEPLACSTPSSVRLAVGWGVRHLLGLRSPPHSTPSLLPILHPSTIPRLPFLPFSDFVPPPCPHLCLLFLPPHTTPGTPSTTVLSPAGWGKWHAPPTPHWTDAADVTRSQACRATGSCKSANGRSAHSNQSHSSYSKWKSTYSDWRSAHSNRSCTPYSSRRSAHSNRSCTPNSSRRSAHSVRSCTPYSSWRSAHSNRKCTPYSSREVRPLNLDPHLQHKLEVRPLNLELQPIINLEAGRHKLEPRPLHNWVLRPQCNLEVHPLILEQDRRLLK